MPTLPLKDYLYLGVIVILLTAFGWYTYHERQIGAAKVAASDQKAVAIQDQRDTALNVAAALANSIAEGTYEKSIATPVTSVPVPVGLCHAARGSSTLPGPASADGSRDTAPDSGTADAGATANLQRFADSAVQIAHDADARATALQSIVSNLRQEMESANVKAK